MIEKLWRRLRGIGDWPETEADVTGVSRFEGRRSRKRAVVILRYKDETGCHHTGQFWVNDYSSIYNLSIGDKTTVRYNPAHPEKYWSDERGLSVEIPLFLIWAVAAVALLSYVLIATRN